jgi:AcrR family transcriptional regulator
MAEATQARTRDASRTRGAILAAAQTAFASRGYAQAGLREIAAAAGVDPALVRRYFGSKEGLFEVALGETLDISGLIDTPRARFGAHIAAYLIEERSGVANPLPMMMMAMADPAIRPLALDLLHARVIAPLAAWIGGPDGAVRAARVSMICSGFLTYWKLLPLDGFANGIDPTTRRWLEESLQAAIDS